MKSPQETKLESLVEEVRDITKMYPKRGGVIIVTEIFTNKHFDFKQYLADMEALGIPEENIGLSFCG